MNPSTRRLASLVSTAVAVLLASPSALADDTEIFVAEPPPGANTAANIMFIIDTSGSMDGAVVTQQAWDPNTDFDGSCRDDRIYWATGSQSAPVCSGSNETDQYITDTNFLCQSALPTLNSAGLVSVTSGIQWRTSNNVNNRRWEELQSGRRTQVDCRADTAVSPANGQSAGDGRYPDNGSNGLYSTNVPGASWWTTNNRNRSYTFYSGNYLNYLRSGGTVTKTRLEVVQEVTISTLDRLSNVNVGLTIFNNSQGGRVIYPMTPIETARDPVKTLVAGLVPDGWTPLSETLFEVYRYWAGLTPRYSNSAASTRVNGNGAFISPLGTESCAKNYNVLLTDGEPTEDVDANTVIPQLTGFIGTNLATPTQCSNNSTGGSDGRCLDDVAKYMFSRDIIPTTAVQDNIITYTVGFGEDVVGSTTLEATADAGGGTAYEASDTASLADVFETIIREIISQDTSFTAPAVSVNAFNRTQNLSDLFITVFEPTSNLRWPGNLKKYRVKPDGTIADANGTDAINATTGFFAAGAQSFWSAGVDGNNVELGGAANEIPLPANRNVYTDLAALGSGSPATLVGVAGNQVTTANGLITPEALGLPTGANAERDELIQWIRGGNVDGGAPNAARGQMGDPLHARPVSVIYGGTPGSPDIRDAVVYVATNEGYLHAIHPNGSGGTGAGEELWTFIPSEMLPRMDALRDNAASPDKGYGLDGNVVAYKLDVNRDGVVDSIAGDRVLLFFGMGRGGYNYYALDVTDKNSPKFLWRRGRDDVMTGLGETWSTPVITRVNVNVSGGPSQDLSKLVMIVGGGYDVTQDNVPYNIDNTGNRLFMLDAITGALLWHGGPTNDPGLGYDSTANFFSKDLTHSIPADIRVIDLSGDGFADRMYAADTGGRVWRFDIFNGNSAANLVTGGVFASLGNADDASHPTSSTRRFYNAPDVSLLRIEGKLVLNIAIGSGYRGHPINAEIQDRFYSLRDKQPFQAYSLATYNALTPITDGASGLIDVTGVATPVVPGTAVGWKLLLNQPSWQGEKVLAESRTFDNKVLISTFTPVPSTSSTNSCVVSGVKNTFYAIDAVNGKIEVKNELRQAGIAPTAVLLFIPNTGVDTNNDGVDDRDANGDGIDDNTGELILGGTTLRAFVGVEEVPAPITNAPVRTFWTQQDVDTN